MEMNFDEDGKEREKPSLQADYKKNLKKDRVGLPTGWIQSASSAFDSS